MPSGGWSHCCMLTTYLRAASTAAGSASTGIVRHDQPPPSTFMHAGQWPCGSLFQIASHFGLEHLKTSYSFSAIALSIC